MSKKAHGLNLGLVNKSVIDLFHIAWGTMPHYTLATFAKMLDQSNLVTVKSSFSLETPISEVCVDSRLLHPGALFFALKGQHVDGHTYLPEIAQRGAIAAVVSNKYSGPSFGMCLFHVEDVQESLQEVATKLLSQRTSKIVAVTGSVGKTTTKDFLSTLLSMQFRVACSPGNSNSQIGVPLAIINHTNGDEDILVLEMGMTHPGNIKKLISIAPPTISLLTTVAMVHACNFNSIDDIALTKAEIFANDSTQLGVLHHDIPIAAQVKAVGKCPKVTFSLVTKEANYYLEENPSLNQMIIHEKGEQIVLSHFPLAGTHNRHNFLAAVVVARALGLTWENIKKGMQNLKLPEKRLQHIEKGGVVYINDSYNAAEVSVKAALQTLPSANGGKKIAVLGSMLELGMHSEDAHRRVGEYALSHVDKLYCLGEECKPMSEVWANANRPVKWFSDRLELVRQLRSDIKEGDSVLLKGSRGTNLWKVFDEL